MHLLLFVLLTFEFTSRAVADDFGVEGGSAISNAEAALATVYGEKRPDLEIILSYAMFKSKIRGIEDINPFGHIALALEMPQGYRVITVNQKSTPGQDKLFFQLSPADYFYGTKPIPGAIHGSNYGLAYARSSASIQLRGIGANSLQRIKDKIEDVDQKHIKGVTTFCIRSNNCAHLTSELLREANIVKSASNSQFPIEVFDQVIDYGLKNSNTGISTEVVFYRKIASDHSYKFENIPVPGYKFFSSMLNILGHNSLHRLNGPAKLVAADAKRESLVVSQSLRASAVSDTCYRLWIAPFIQAILRRK